MNDKAHQDQPQFMSLRQVVEASGLRHLFTARELTAVDLEPNPEPPHANYGEKHFQAVINVVQEMFDKHEPTLRKTVCINTVFVEEHRARITRHFYLTRPDLDVHFYKGIGSTMIYFTPKGEHVK